jgi:hypothetical protein
MFVQVIQAKVSDKGQARAALDRWMSELAPGSVGWLGSTAGVTEDGTLVAVARFESEEAAQRNSDRPEQDQWWTETSKLFTGEPTFLNSNNAIVDLNGDPDAAGFVQVMQGRTTDPERSREMMTEDSTNWAEYRPDVVGSVMAEHEDGAFTMVLYFTSEAEAREGESKEPPPELRAQMAEMEKLAAEPTRFYDLKEPWLYSPR